MTPDEIRHLRQLIAEATPGPWCACPMNMYVFAADNNMVCEIRGYGAEVCGQRPKGAQDANITLLVAAHTALPKLLDELERTRFAFAELIDLKATLYPKDPP